MENRSQVEAVISKFFEALNIDDASGISLAKQVEYYAMMSPNPICGESDVRGHIQQIAPFMLNEKHGKMIIEGGSVAVMCEFDIVNGQHNEGAFFFEIKNDQISEVRVIFDTRRLFEGKSNS